MRQPQSESQSSWSHYAKAAAVFTLTTATYLLARTTGWLPRWFSVGKAEENQDAQSVQLSHRHLLQHSSVTIVEPIPDQTIQIGQPYEYPLNHVFSGNYSLLGAIQPGQSSLPAWLKLQYQLIGNFLPQFFSSFGIKDVVISNNLAYVVDFGFGLVILDVSVPSHPMLLGTYSNSLLRYSGCERVALSGSIVFLLARFQSQFESQSSLYIFNATFPDNLELLGYNNMTTPFEAFGLSVIDNIVFVSDSDGYVSIVNVSDLTHPFVMSNFTCPGFFSAGFNSAVVAIDHIAFVGSASLYILNVTDPRTPQLITTYTSHKGSFFDFVFSNNTLFVAGGSCFSIIDVSNISQPMLISTYPTGDAQRITLSGNVVMVADQQFGFLVFDVSLLTAPQLIGGYPQGGGNAWGMAISGQIAYTSDAWLGLLILNLTQGSLVGFLPVSQSGLQFPVAVSAYNGNAIVNTNNFVLTLDQLPYKTQSILSDQSLFSGQTVSLPIQSDLLFVNPANSFLKLSLGTVNESTIPNWLKLAMTPTLLSNPLQSYGDTNALALVNNTLFVAEVNGVNGIAILDVSTLTNPRILSTFNTGVAFDVTVSGELAFVADYLNGLVVLNISNLAKPTLLSTYSTNPSISRAEYIKIVGDIAFLSTDTEFLMLNISNPHSPQFLYNNSAHQGTVAVSDNILFLISGYQGLALNISNPLNVTLISEFSVSSSSNVVFKENLLFLANEYGLIIVNVSQPKFPQVTGKYMTNLGYGLGVTVVGTTVFLADNNAGILVIDVTNISEPQLITSYTPAFGQAQKILVSGNTAFVANYGGGVLILDISQWEIMISPDMADVGNYPLRLTATDELGGSSYIDFTVRVEGPPQLRGNILTQHAWVGQLLTYFVPNDLFVDPNGDLISTNVFLADEKPLPSWLSFSSISISFGGMPQASDAGNLTIILSATDHICPEIATINFTISVGFLPVLNHRIPNQLAPIGSLYQFSVPKNSFFDPAGLALSYLAQGVNNQLLPSWLQFNSSSLSFFGVANTSNITVYILQLIATNSAGGQVIASFTLRTDHFPVFNKILSLPIASINQPWVWTLPRGTFIDAEGDPLTYSAVQEDGSSLPSWLSFNPITRTFTGVPLFTGIQSLKITAQDNYGGSNSTYFNITILPESQAGSTIATRAGKSFAFQVNVSGIFDDGQTFSYSASLTDGASLPSWLQFISNNLSFAGLPNSSDVGSYNITLTLTASDLQGVQYNISFVLNVNLNYPPQVYLPISNQVAQVNEPFVFYVSEQTFVDPNGDSLTYTVNILPSWLSFDPQQLKFWGTPARSDTDPLTAHVNNIEFIAHDDKSQTSTLFTISVQGTSNLLLSLQIGVPLLSVLVSLWKVYQNRALLLNRCCRGRILKCDVTAVIGEEFQLNLITQPEEVGSLRVKLPNSESVNSTTSCCARLFRPCKRILRESPDYLPQDLPLPKWLGYYADHNRLFSKGCVPVVNHPQFTVQVLNSAKVIREEVNLMVQTAKV